MNKKYTVQVIPGYYEVWVMPIIEGNDKQYYVNGAGGFFDISYARNKKHSTFFKNANTLNKYINTAKRKGFDDDVIDPYGLLPPATEYEEEEEKNEIEIKKWQQTALDIKTEFYREMESVITNRKVG